MLAPATSTRGTKQQPIQEEQSIDVAERCCSQGTLAGVEECRACRACRACSSLSDFVGLVSGAKPILSPQKHTCTSYCQQRGSRSRLEKRGCLASSSSIWNFLQRVGLTRLGRKGIPNERLGNDSQYITRSHTHTVHAVSSLG